MSKDNSSLDFETLLAEFQQKVWEAATDEDGAAYDEAGLKEAKQLIELFRLVDVRKIMLDIVPGDGSGEEIYAKSVSAVEDKLGALYLRIEELEQQILNLKV